MFKHIKKCDAIQSIIKINNLFYDFLDFLESLLCHCCYVWHNNLNSKQLHHMGGFLYLLSKNPKISYDQFQSFNKDIEHGFLHGICTAFWSYAQNENKKLLYNKIAGSQGFKPVWEKDLSEEAIYYSCLFHDFMKTINENDQHDQKLQNFFPLCIQETYRHEKPFLTDNNNTLIVSDRIELFRYNNNEWINKDTLASSKFYIQNQELVASFYKHLRQCLEYIYVNLDQLWLSHTSENMYTKTYDLHKDHYPSYYWIAKDETSKTYGFDEDVEKYVSVNMDYLPLSNCHYGIIHMHSIVGLITKKDFVSYGNEIRHTPKSVNGRDHAFMYINQKIPINDWIFCYVEDKELRYIDFDEANVISYKNVNKFYKIVRMLKGKIEGLKVSK